MKFGKFKEIGNFSDVPKENRRKTPSDVPTAYDEVGKPELDSINELKQPSRPEYKTAIKNLFKIDRVVQKITEERNANRARQLVRKLDKAQKRNGYGLGKILQKNAEGGLKRYNVDLPSLYTEGLGQTLEYLSLNEKDKKNFSFDRKFGGWGLYERLENGNHKGDTILPFSRVGGNTNLTGERVAAYSDIEGTPNLQGNLPALKSNIRGEPNIFGYSPAKEAKIQGNPQIGGYNAADGAYIDKNLNPLIKNYGVSGPSNAYETEGNGPKIPSGLDGDEKKSLLDKFSKSIGMSGYADMSLKQRQGKFRDPERW